MNDPLASRIRPTELSDVVGQRHLLAPGKPLYNLIQSGNIPNLIFYGPSGTGKTLRESTRWRWFPRLLEPDSMASRRVCAVITALRSFRR